MRNCNLVTGGAGFIGNFVLQMVSDSDTRIVNLDKLTYAGNLQNLESLQAIPRHTFVHGDIRDRELIRSLLIMHRLQSSRSFRGRKPRGFQ